MDEAWIKFLVASLIPPLIVFIKVLADNRAIRTELQNLHIDDKIDAGLLKVRLEFERALSTQREQIAKLSQKIDDFIHRNERQ